MNGDLTGNEEVALFILTLVCGLLFGYVCAIFYEMEKRYKKQKLRWLIHDIVEEELDLRKLE